MPVSVLELRSTDSTTFFDLWADGKKVGHLGWLARDDEDPADYKEGWSAELWGSSLWQKQTENHSDIKDAIAAARLLNDERAEHERNQRQIDRNRPRTVTIPSGGQPK